MPGFVFNESTTTFFATDTGTVAAGLLVATVPNYSVTTSTAYIYISNIGVSNNNAATVLITSANAPEISTATTIKRVNSIFINSSLSITGNETTEPVQVYTRDATVNYGKTQWIIPEPMNVIRGQPITTSTVVIGAIVTSTYVRSTATGSVNAFRITPTTLIKNNYIPVTVDVGGVCNIEQLTGTTTWTFNISGLKSVSGFSTGTIISAISNIGSIGIGNIVYVTAINSGTNTLTCGAYGGNSPTTGTIIGVHNTGEVVPKMQITAVTTITTGSVWNFTISGIRGTADIVSSGGTGTVITVTTGSGMLGSAGGNTLVTKSVNSLEEISIHAYGGTTPIAGEISSIVYSATVGSFPIFGDNEFITPGTYSWTAPSGVTSVSVVAIGGGGAGYNNWANAGGAGGGLGWKNNVSVTPGTSYTVQVGAGGIKNGGAGGNSYFISLATVAGYGGGNATANTNTGGPNANGYGGGYVGDGGGAGGNATNYTGGGGAGGYSGTGGNQGALPAASSGGAAGGGYYSSTYGSGAGGGVGIYGKGDTATGWYHGSSGQVFSTSQGNGGGGAGGSGGTRGLSGENPTNSFGESGNSDGYGGTFGGGGGGPGTSWPSASGSGGKGGVRIIWGTGRAFPNTQTTPMSAVSTITVLATRSKNIGGPTDSYKTSVSINRMPYPESIGIDRPDTLVIVNTINTATTKVRIFANQGTNTYGSGSKSTTDSLTGSTDFYVAGTGTGTISSGTTITRYWI